LVYEIQRSINTAPQLLLPKEKGSNPHNSREVRISNSNENNFNYTVTKKVAKVVIASARFPENP